MRIPKTKPKPGLEEMQKHRQLQQECYREIQPYIRQKIRIHNMLCPQLIVYPDGRFDSHYEYSPEVISMLAELDILIDDIKDQYDKTIL